MRNHDYFFKPERFLLVFLLLTLFNGFSLNSVNAQEPELLADNSSNSKKVKNYLKSRDEKHLDMGNTSLDDIIKTAQTYIGTPHCMGGHSKKCTDCSGFVMAVFAEYGIKLPHGSQDQSYYGEVLQSRKDLKEGDLVFFYKTYNTSNLVTHTGIYLGDNKFIHASSSKGVTISSLVGTWWEDKFIFGTRIF